MRRNRRRRVLIIVQNLPVPLDRRVWMECQALIAAGYGVSVICPKGPGDPAFQELDGVRIHKYAPPAPARGLLGFVWEFAYCWLRTAWLAMRIFARDGFDAIQACNPPDTYFALAALFKPRRVRFVYDQHDLCPEVYLSRFDQPSRLVLAGLRALESATYRLADQVVSTNSSFRRMALERGGKHPSAVTVVRSGPRAQRMRAGAAVPTLKRGKRHLCCYLGVMGPQDGVDLLLRAIAVLVHEQGRDDCHFALLGFGDCFDDLGKLAKELNLEDYVTFTGRADDDMIRDYLSTADLGLSPDPKNTMNDLCTMNKTLEYMAFGLPVVAFDLTETRVSAGPAAVYAEPNDVTAFAGAVGELLDDPTRRTRMGAVARRRIETSLSWEHQAEAYVSVYDRLFAGDARMVSVPQARSQDRSAETVVERGAA